VQETFHIQLGNGEALLAELEGKLVADDGSLRHPSHRENAYIVCLGPEAAAYMKAELLENGDKALSGVGLLVLYTSAVTVYQCASAEVLEKLQALLWPLLRAPGALVLDEYANDRTDEYAKDFSQLFV
tara:strand:- start:42174 stop:42557 length:384 start_codon:yes stop_codon:yes gene_type:complete